MSDQIAAIILGAGKGTRMKSDLPKVMMPLAGKPMIRHPIDTLEQMGVKKIVVVTAPDGEMVRREVAPHLSCIQEKQLGTGHAVLSAKEQMKGFDGAVLVIFGDNPIITKETYQMAADKVKEGYAVVVLGFRPADAARYGRLVMENGELKKIVEFKDASDEEKAINLCNSGCMCFDGKTMFELLEAIGNENAAGEYYLTDAVAVARQKGLKCTVVECSPEEVVGANTREELALLESFLNKRKGK